MISPITNELTQAKQLMNESKFREAINILNRIEDKKSLSIQDQFELHYLKSSLFLELGYMEKALKFVKIAYKESKILSNEFQTIDVLFTECKILAKSDKQNEALKVIRKTERLLNTIPQTSTIKFKQRKAVLLLIKGGVCFNIGELNSSLEYAAKGLTIAEEIDNKKLIMLGNKALSFSYYLKGNIEQSHEHTKNTLALAKELNDKQEMIGAYNGFGMYFTDKGDYEQALDYLEQSLSLCYEIESFKTIVVLGSLFDVYLQTNSFEKAQNCLNKMKQFLDAHIEFKASSAFYHIASAVMLIKNPENVNYLKAKEILKQIVDEENPFSELYYLALIYLCDICLSILCKTNDLQTLDEIYPYITQLKNIAKTQQSFWLLIETYILQAKLNLIKFDFRKARNLLSNALDISKKYGQERLFTQILNEQEELSKNFIKWEKLKVTGADISERMELARIDEQIESIIQKRKYLKIFQSKR
ncbi:MAG: tetratricopeptide repeat protein [Candidatus Thorarchaeota archaeon]